MPDKFCFISFRAMTVENETRSRSRGQNEPRMPHGLLYISTDTDGNDSITIWLLHVAVLFHFGFYCSMRSFARSFKSLSMFSFEKKIRSYNGKI